MIKDISHLKNKVKELLIKQKLGVLATHGETYPYNTLICYAFTKDLRFILFATMRHTRKYRNIVSHSSVSMLIDNRTNYAGDFKHAVALTITGKTVKAKKSLKTKYRRLYLKRFPHLKGFINDPDTSIVTVKVDRYIFVQRFQEVSELKIKDV
ncbi:MAG: pyridoxamine 5'-phosphate oxidase family protein [Candidatus Omnitrophota bacterium]|nr:pyridoxamine 5'-phosphate oxidase family protein [Candidatus Omnitrophota bacterium]MBU1912870.1 pyridoxamine 5'-phosphate oxidase family protein [Candidatus Omnitrophota bacterium]